MVSCDNCGRATRRCHSKELDGERYCGRSQCKAAFNDHLATVEDSKYTYWT